MSSGVRLSSNPSPSVTAGVTLIMFFNISASQFLIWRMQITMMIYFMSGCENKCELSLKKQLSSWSCSKCSSNTSYFYYPSSAYLNSSVLFLVPLNEPSTPTDMSRVLHNSCCGYLWFSFRILPGYPSLSHSFSTLGSHKLLHRVLKYALFICQTQRHIYLPQDTSLDIY